VTVSEEIFYRLDQIGAALGRTEKRLDESRRDGETFRVHYAAAMAYLDDVRRGCLK